MTVETRGILNKLYTFPSKLVNFFDEEDIIFTLISLISLTKTSCPKLAMLSTLFEAFCVSRFCLWQNRWERDSPSVFRFRSVSGPWKHPKPLQNHIKTTPNFILNTPNYLKRTYCIGSLWD